MIPNSVAGTMYTLQWQEITTYPDTTNQSSTTKNEDIRGTGSTLTPAPGTIHEVPMPLTPSSIYETAPTIIRASAGGGGGPGGGGTTPGTGGQNQIAGT